MISFNWTEIDLLYAQGLAAGRQGVVGLLVLRGRGSDLRIFAQSRSLTRKLFPGCWDFVGGHLEAGKV